MKCKIGIMQGRLSKTPDGVVQKFPSKNWEKEFFILNKIGYDGIELIFDTKKNPLFSESGIKKIKKLSKENNIETPSVIFDYLKTNPLIGKKRLNNLNVIKKLLKNMNKIDSKNLCIALIENNKIDNSYDLKLIVPLLKKICNYAYRLGITITLETDLSATNLKKLINLVNYNNLKINLDVGNIVALGYDMKDYLLQLKKYIYSIHIKDRDTLFGNNVPLGLGSVNFQQLFEILNYNKFNGYLIIEGARKKNLEKTFTEYHKFLTKFINKYNEK
tara:strand:+ start:426 stop:1247 length:822 start_codon:yes stop_codon:yes gene_type:complete